MEDWALIKRYERLRKHSLSQSTQNCDQFYDTMDNRRNENCEHVTMDYRSYKTILLVGTTGVGKSSFGNYLTRTRSFKISHTCDAGTTEPQSEEFFDERSKFYKVIDTPGVNDKNDLENIKKLMKLIGNCPVHCVVLCLAWDTKGDVNVKHTIEFYKELLLPLVKAGNLILVITKFPPENYTELKNDETLIKKKNQLEDMVNSILGYKIGLVEVTNVGKLNQKEEIFHVTKAARFRILQMASKFKPQYLGLIPLPPDLRNNQTIIIKSMKREITQKKDDIAKLKDQLPRTITEYQNELHQKSDILNDLKITEQEKSQLQNSPHHYTFGNELINLGRLSDQFIKVPVTALDIKLDSIVWNCGTPTMKSSQIENDMVIVYFDVVPDLITFKKNNLPELNDEPRTWFAVVWVTYNLVTQMELDDLRKKIVEQEKIISDLRTKIKSIKPMIDEEATKKVRELEELRRKVSLLKRSSFTLHEIDEVVKIIDEQTCSNDDSEDDSS